MNLNNGLSLNGVVMCVSVPARGIMNLNIKKPCGAGGVYPVSVPARGIMNLNKDTEELIYSLNRFRPRSGNYESEYF